MKLPKSIIVLYVLSLFHLSITCQVSGVHNMDQYLHFLKKKNIAVVVNHTSMINNKHLVDTLVQIGVNLKLIFSPEHGFYGNFNAGEYVLDSLYNGSIPIISLYGKNKKLKDEYLKNIDVVIFDIQDVGVRFYTYISTLHYVMESCAKNGVQLIVLDRPNPHVNYVDGPVLEPAYSSFVGMHPVPIVYGMTIGEYALMVNGEEWLGDELKTDLHIVENVNYVRSKNIKIDTPFPSPNLRTMNAIFLYPSLCLFEGTLISVGRGTEYPFEMYGAPFFTTDFSFTPTPDFGAQNPKHKDEVCYGFDLRNKNNKINQKDLRQININYLLQAYHSASSEHKKVFFNSFFNKLAGNSSLQHDIINNVSEYEIRLGWKKNIDDFMAIREKYLLYN